MADGSGSSDALKCLGLGTMAGTSAILVSFSAEASPLVNAGVVALTAATAIVKMVCLERQTQTRSSGIDPGILWLASAWACESWVGAESASVVKCVKQKAGNICNQKLVA